MIVFDSTSLLTGSMFTLDINSVIAFSWHVWPLRRNYHACPPLNMSAQAPHRKAFSIIHDKVFLQSNKALYFHLNKTFGEDGVLSLTKHKQAPGRENVEQLFTAKQLGNDTPESLVQTSWGLRDALLLQARPRKREKYGKGRYCFGKCSERPGIYCPSRASDKRSSWRPPWQRR